MAGVPYIGIIFLFFLFSSLETLCGLIYRETSRGSVRNGSYPFRVRYSFLIVPQKRFLRYAKLQATVSVTNDPVPVIPSELQSVDEWFQQHDINPTTQRVIRSLLSCAVTNFSKSGFNKNEYEATVLKFLYEHKDILNHVITKKQTINLGDENSKNLGNEKLGWTVVVDPLEGSYEDGNFFLGTMSSPVSSVFSIWNGNPLKSVSSSDSRSSRHVRARKSLIASVVVLYGRTLSVIMGLTGTDGAHAFTHCQNSGLWRFYDTITSMKSLKRPQVQSGTRVCGTTNWNAVMDNSGFRALVEAWRKENYDIISNNSFVNDAISVLFSNAEAKMYVNPQTCIQDSRTVDFRLLHHGIPLAHIFSQAGGSSSNGLTHILDLKALSVDDMTQAGFGAAVDVDFFNQIVGPPRASMSRRTVSNEPAEQGKFQLIMSNPRGFCEGVNRAVDTVEEALRVWGAPIYVKHEIVHNELVCNKLREKGAIFVEDLNDVPKGSVIIYSSHGIPPHVREEAKARNLIEVDATCPLVTKVHVYVKKKAKEGYKIILVGHKNHVEVIGTAGEAPSSTTIVESVEDVNQLEYTENDKLFYTTQTTLSMDDCKSIVDALVQRYPNIESIPSGSICYATTNRQTALRHLVPNVDLALVVGSELSSNARRLVETAAYRGVRAYLVNDSEDVDPKWLQGVKHIGLTSSASTPEDAVQRVVQRLKELGVGDVQEYIGVDERLPNWRLPRNLEIAAQQLDDNNTSE